MTLHGGGASEWAWAAILALGVFHGANPGMGWLFAVSNGMQERSLKGVLVALPPLAFGHLLAIAAVLLPVSLLSLYVVHLHLLRLLAGLLLISFGIFKLIQSRHPRYLARIGRGHLVLWSFLMATSHGAGLMLIPFFLDVERLGVHPAVHMASMAHLAQGGIVMALMVTLAHTLSMILTVGVIAWLVYRYLGLRMLQKSWFNLDLVWSLFLILVGGIALLA